MTTAYVAMGTLTDGKTVVLDESLPELSGRVRMTLEIVPPNVPGSFQKVLEQIWEDQRRRGHIPPTAEEVDRRIREERESWND